MSVENALSEEKRAKIAEIAGRYHDEPDQLMRIMFDVQEESGNGIPREAALIVSEVTGIPISELYGYITFYSMLSDQPRGKYVVRICKSVPCHVRGSRGIYDAIVKTLGIQPGETTRDGLFTLETCECLGLCVESPAIMINEKAYSNLTPGRVITLLEKYQDGEVE